MKRVLAICGSLSSTSENLALLKSCCALAPSGLAVELSALPAQLPQFNPELERGGELSVVQAWRASLSESDALLIAVPEYGFSFPGSLKNAIDWVIGTGELERKLVALTASVPHAQRGLRGIQALLEVMQAVSARVVHRDAIVRGAGQHQDAELLMKTLAEALVSTDAD